MSKYQPALLGGLFIGVLSSLPFVGAANLCCCLWVVVGGLLVVYLQQQNTPLPVATGDAALGGLMAGAVGAVLFVAVNAIIMRTTQPVMLEELRSQMGNSQMPPEAAAFVERLFTGQTFALAMFAVTVPMFAVFALLGSLLGLAFFRKKVPAPPAPPAQG